MKCPDCQARLECSDSRHHDFNTIKRRRSCTQCDFITNSIEVLLPEDLKGARTPHIVYQVMQAAHGASESDKIITMLRALADDLEKRYEQARKRHVEPSSQGT